MRAPLPSLVLALFALSCGPSQRGAVRAASSVTPKEVLCGDADCTPFFRAGACQWIAGWARLDGVFSDVRISSPLTGSTTVVAGGVSYTIELQEDGTTFDWSAGGPVDLVVAAHAAGPDVYANVYPYVPPATADTQLTAPGPEPLTEVLFCLRQQPPPPSAGDGCTLTQGYWKTHSRQGPAPYDARWGNLGALEEETPFFRSGQTWLQVLGTPVRGSAYEALAHQYAAAKLNVLAGASADALGGALSTVEAFFEAATPATVLTAAQRAEALRLAALLDDFNSGRIGPGHCD